MLSSCDPLSFTVCKAVVACPEETCRRNAGLGPTWLGRAPEHGAKGQWFTPVESQEYSSFVSLFLPVS